MTAEYQVGEARTDELVRCGEMFEALMQLHAAHPEFFAVTPDVVGHKAAEYSAMIAQGSGKVFVARLDGEAVAMVIAFSRRAPEYFQVREYGYIADVFVEPAHRRKGLTRRLIETCLRYLAGSGIRSVRLTNAFDNAAAEAAWPALGFRDVLRVRVRNIGPDGE